MSMTGILNGKDTVLHQGDLVSQVEVGRILDDEDVVLDKRRAIG